MAIDLLLQHDWHKHVESVNDTPHIDPNDPLPLSDGILPQPGIAAYTSVIAEQMHTTKGAQDLVCEILDITGLCHIGDYSHHCRPIHLEFMCGLGQRLFLDIRQDDFHPFVRTTFGETTADATGSTSNDGNLVSELFHDRTSVINRVMTSGRLVHRSVWRRILAYKEV